MTYEEAKEEISEGGDMTRANSKKSPPPGVFSSGCVIAGRHYGCNGWHNTYMRIVPSDETPRPPFSDAEPATNLLNWHYWRSDLEDYQNEQAKVMAQAIEADQSPDAFAFDINVWLTAVRIVKEREFLRCVVCGDEDTIRKLNADEAANASLAEKLGGKPHAGGVIVQQMEAA